MAKMFYTLEEAAERLGLGQDKVKEMAASGKLQQFRDRDKLMFKREQVENLADAGGSLGGSQAEASAFGIPLQDPGPDDTDAMGLSDEMGGTDTIKLSGDSDATSSGNFLDESLAADTADDDDDPLGGSFSLEDTNVGASGAGRSGSGMPGDSLALASLDDADSSGSSITFDAFDEGDSSGSSLALDTAPDEPEDPKEATGISVFDAGEVEPADPLAQTQVTRSDIDDEELALESVGSGSGLLDLTRESDDTSLGAELLDEIYPGGESAAGASATNDFNLESAVGSSGVFDGALSMETGTAGPSGLENLTAGDPGSMDAPMPAGEVGAYATVDESDPAGSALGAGLLMGATLALIIGLAVVVAALAGTRSAITSALVSDDGAINVLFLALGLAVVAALLGGVGMVLAKNSR